jgi:hypothetical protein
MIEGSSPSRGWEFSLHYDIQTVSGAHPASLLSNGYQELFPWVKRPGREADHSHPSSAEVKNMWSYISTPPIRPMAWCSVKNKHRDYFTFAFTFIFTFTFGRDGRCGLDVSGSGYGPVADCCEHGNELRVP